MGYYFILLLIHIYIYKDRVSVEGIRSWGELYACECMRYVPSAG
jgi:hypothetical protein